MAASFEIVLRFKEISESFPVIVGQRLGRAVMNGPESREFRAVSRQVVEVVAFDSESVRLQKVTPKMQCKIIDSAGGEQTLTTSDFRLRVGEKAAFSGHQCVGNDDDVVEIRFPPVSISDCFLVSLKPVAAPVEVRVKAEPTVELPAVRPVVIKAEPVKAEPATRQEEPKAAEIPVVCEAAEPKAVEIPIVRKEAGPEKAAEIFIEREVAEPKAAENPSLEPPAEPIAAESPEPAAPAVVKSEDGVEAIMESEQSVQIQITFPGRDLKTVKFAGVMSDEVFGRTGISQAVNYEKIRNIKTLIPKEAFSVDNVKTGGDEIEISNLSPLFKCYLVSDGQAKIELPDSFCLKRKEVVLFFNKARLLEDSSLDEDRALFSVCFVEDEINLLTDDDEEELESIEPLAEGEDSSGENAYDEDDGFIDTELDDFGQKVGMEVASMMDISMKHLAKQCREEKDVGVFFEIQGRDELMAAHEKLEDRVKSLKLVPESERKDTFGFVVQNVDDNEECDKKPFLSFEAHRKLLEGLYIQSHLNKQRGDEPCFAYRPPKPVEPSGSPAPKRARTIKPTVVPHAEAVVPPAAAPEAVAAGEAG